MAFNIISRARRYIDAIPLSLCIADINDYLMTHELPVPIDVFIDTIFTLDNLAVEEMRKKKPSK